MGCAVPAARLSPSAACGRRRPRPTPSPRDARVNRRYPVPDLPSSPRLVWQGRQGGGCGREGEGAQIGTVIDGGMKHDEVGTSGG